MKLLLAEDEKALSDALITLLEKNKYEIEAVYDGNQALKHMEMEYYDAAIFDVMMPGMDGITLTKRIREKGIAIPILMLTARSDVENRVTGFDSGANDYLPKPFDTRDLLARIRAMLRVDDMAGTGLLQTGDLKLDMASLVLSSNTGSFRLSGKEMKIMRMLMKNPENYVLSEHFVECAECSGSDAKNNDDVAGKAINAYVMFLNRKLDALHSDMQIIKKNTGLSLQKR